MTVKIKPRNLKQQVIIERKKRDKIFFIAISIIYLYIGIAMFFGERGLLRYLEIKKIEKKLQTEIITLEKKKQELNKEIQSLKNNPFYIEKHAREEFGLAKPDEYIFQFQENDR